GPAASTALRRCDVRANGTGCAATRVGGAAMPKDQGLDAEAIDQETAVALPERDAMSLVDGGAKLVPIATIAPEPQINPDPNAAFAIALLRAISKLFDLPIDDAATARIAHAAENEFAGARSGMLDQLASVYGRSSDALLIDMRDHGTQVIPLPPTIELAVIDS